MKTAVRTLKSQAGFSLIELMIVVAIIGILASIAVPNFQKFQRRAKQTEGKGYVANIYTAEKGFIAEWNVYTSSMPGIGFAMDPAAVGCYRGGINAAAVAVTGSTVQASDATTVAPPFPGNGCTQGTAANVGGSYTTSTFTAGASAATLYAGATSPDTWQINDSKVLSNTSSGL